MAFFEWADDMVIDNGAVDADHRHLIDLVNRLHSATREGEGQAIVAQVLDQLVTYTREHFAREERLMELAKFKRLDEHRRDHRQLVDSVEQLVQTQAAGRITTAARVSLLLRDWLSLHIRRADRELRDYLRPRLH